MIKLLLAAVLGSAMGGSSAQAQTLADKTVTMIIASGPGGGFDLWGRMVARHIGRHLPGRPNVVPQNMPGAGGFVAANHLYNVAPKDGTAMAIMPAGTPLGPIMGASGARFDATRFTWVGTPATETPVCIAFNGTQAKVRTVADLYEHELVVGSTGPGAGPHTWPKALAALLGMKFRVVAGFPSTANIFLAIERGEIDGICTIFDTIIGQRPDWIPNEKATMLFHGGGAPSVPCSRTCRLPAILQRPTEQTGGDRACCSPAPGSAGRSLRRPDMPADRVKMLQGAFMATMRGRGVPRGRQEAEGRRGAARWRLSRGSDQAGLRHAQADCRQGRRIDKVAAKAVRQAADQASLRDKSTGEEHGPRRGKDLAPFPSSSCTPSSAPKSAASISAGRSTTTRSRQIKNAWYDHTVLVFRDQKLSEDDQRRFASYFGPVAKRVPPRPGAVGADTLIEWDDMLLVTDNVDANGKPIGALGHGEMWFHSDKCYHRKPHRASFLYGIEIPTEGGHTKFSSSYAAYERLPAT